MDSPFEIKITNITEVRMGSPYNSCEIELVGFNKIKLSKHGNWQDKYAWSAEVNKLVLIQFDFEDNIPGFRLFIINTITGTAKWSNRYTGLINDISIVADTVRINKFVYNKELSIPAETLCCNVEQTLELH